MSYTYTVLVIMYAAAATFLAYVPDEDLESLAEVIALLIALVVLAVSADEIWG